MEDLWIRIESSGTSLNKHWTAKMDLKELLAGGNNGASDSLRVICVFRVESEHKHSYKPIERIRKPKHQCLQV